MCFQCFLCFVLRLLCGLLVFFASVLRVYLLFQVEQVYTMQLSFVQCIGWLAHGCIYVLLSGGLFIYCAFTMGYGGLIGVSKVCLSHGFHHHIYGHVKITSSTIWTPA